MHISRPRNTLGIYEKAFSFQENFGNSLLVPGSDDYDAMKKWVLYQNDNNPLAGVGLEVGALTHILSPTDADAPQKNIRLTNYTLASGTYEGVLRGYTYMLYANPWTGACRFVLATVLRINLPASGEEYHPTVAQTPIPGADIELIS